MSKINHLLPTSSLCCRSKSECPLDSWQIADSRCFCEGKSFFCSAWNHANNKDRVVRKQSLAVALTVTVLLVLYMLSPSWQSRSMPVPVEQTPSEPPRGATHDSSPLTTPPRCSVTKVTMLYGAHKFSQLEDALEVHRRHSERWVCGFESLDRDLTTRKVYIKHYFLLSTILHELSKPEEERQQWLL
jgi:hypothetical protein